LRFLFVRGAAEAVTKHACIVKFRGARRQEGSNYKHASKSLPGDVGSAHQNLPGKEANLVSAQRLEGVWFGKSREGILAVVHRADGSGVGGAYPPARGWGKARAGHVSQGLTAKLDVKGGENTDSHPCSLDGSPGPLPLYMPTLMVPTQVQSWQRAAWPGGT